MSLRFGAVAFLAGCLAASTAALGGDQPPAAPVPSDLSGPAASCDSCGDVGCDWGCGGINFGGSTGLVAGFEMTFLKPHINAAESIAIIPGLPLTEIEDNEYNASPRFWLGYVGDCGLGWRIRWWEFNHTLNGETFEIVGIGNILVESLGGLEVEALDIEMTQEIDLGLWDMTVGGGVRYGRTEHVTAQLYDDVLMAGFDDLAVASDFDGIGPTLFAEMRRPVGCNGFAFVGNMRASLLFGEDKLAAGFDDTDDGLLIVETAQDNVVGVLEAQLGGEYSSDIGCGTRVFARGMAEGQLWTDATRQINIAANSIESSDIGLVGLTFGIGVAR
ncbi:MAG: hypothetical protein KJZ87_26285 [Thermoguttaceae bacterium]|nr:hypothetical protein [Thermoguttaceae bacterium]